MQHGELDIAAMQQAAAYFVGTHDFRSFCKVDAQHVSTFCRTILDFRQGLSSCWPLSACSQTKDSLNGAQALYTCRAGKVGKKRKVRELVRDDCADLVI